MKKRILIIYAKSTSEIFNRQSALGSYIFCLAGILYKNGYDITINNIPFDNQLKQSNQALSVTKTSGSFIKKLLPSFFKEAIKDLQLFRSMDLFCKSIDTGKEFDKIIEFYTYGSEVGFRLSQKYNKPLVLIYDNPVLEEHTFFHSGQLFFKNKIELRERSSILNAQSLVIYSNPVKKYLETKYQAKLNAFIHQNVDFTRFDFIPSKICENTINIGFLGSFLKWHRVDILLNVFVRLKMEGHSIRLFLIGNGMEYESIRQKVETLNLHKDIVMPGFADGGELLNYKLELHIGVMPGSNWYGAPNKIFEYGAAHLAVIAPDTPTIKDLFRDKEELLLFKQDDEADMYLKLKSYIIDRDLLSKCAIKLQNKIRANYSENSTFTFYKDLLEK